MESMWFDLQCRMQQWTPFPQIWVQNTVSNHLVTDATALVHRVIRICMSWLSGVERRAVFSSGAPAASMRTPATVNSTSLNSA